MAWSRARNITAVAALGALVLSGCGGGESEASNADAITVYSTMMPPVQERLAEAFAEKTGLEVNSVRVQSADLARRFDEEWTANQNIADVVTLNELLYFEDAAEAGKFVELTEIPGFTELDERFRVNDASFVTTMAPTVFAYNTDMVAEADVPQDYGDLLDPRFKGKILVSDPRTNSELSAKFWYALKESQGEEWFERFRAQDLQLAASTTPGMEDVVAGEAAMILPAYDMNLTPYEGTDAPVAVTPPLDTSTALTFFTGISSKAKNPEGAEDWVEFTLSEEGQSIINDGIGVSPLGNQVPGSLPMPDGLVEPSAEEALADYNHLLDLLGIEG
jgi:iron(III) transport system substrate-binding protein